MLEHHFDESITCTHTNRKYTSLQIQYTRKEAHLTPTDISEDWRTHISKYFISYVGNSQSEHIEMYARTSIPKGLLNECIYVCNLCLNFVRGKGENLCVRGESGVILTPSSLFPLNDKL